MREMEYRSCPFCAWSRPVSYGHSQKTGLPREVRFDRVNPGQVKVLQTRELTGSRPHQKPGGHITIIESKTLSELPEELKKQIRNQCEKILKALD